MGAHTKHMKSTSVRHDLSTAADALSRAAETTTDPDVRAKLTGMADQLRYAAGDDTTDPEALVQPSPSTLDTIQRELETLMESASDSEKAELRTARNRLLVAIITLDDQWRTQNEYSSI